MYSISKTIDIAYSHRLLLDYKSKCSNLHGHNGTIIVTLHTNEVNDDGMIIDFTILNTILNTAIINKYDHTVFINIEDAQLLEFCKASCTKFVLFFSNTTSENIAKCIWNDIAQELLKLKKNRKIVIPGLKNLILTVEFNESGNNSVSYSNLICNKSETENKNIKQNIEQKIESDKNINVKKVFVKDNLDNTDDPVLFKIVLG